MNANNWRAGELKGGQTRNSVHTGLRVEGGAYFSGLGLRQQHGKYWRPEGEEEHECGLMHGSHFRWLNFQNAQGLPSGSRGLLDWRYGVGNITGRFCSQSGLQRKLFRELWEEGPCIWCRVNRGKSWDEGGWGYFQHRKAVVPRWCSLAGELQYSIFH